MSKVLERLEGCLLLAAGCLVLILASGDGYLSFMNPRFRWLSLAAGIALVLLGSLTLVRPHHVHHWSRTLTFVPFLALFALSLTSGGRPANAGARSQPAAAAGTATPVDPPLPAMQPVASSTLPSVEEDDPNPITAAELYVLAKRGGADQVSRRYVLHGVVRRPLVLDDSGLFLVLRTFIYCCSVDATAVGFLVSSTGVALPDDGAWVRITGKLEKHDGDGTTGLDADVGLPGAYFTAVHPGYRLAAERVQIVEPPEVEFTYSLNEEEPYGF